MALSDTFLDHFASIKDDRLQTHNFRHRLSDILIIAILATICGADGWAEIARFGIAKQEWLSLELNISQPHQLILMVLTLRRPSWHLGYILGLMEGGNSLLRQGL